MFVVAVADLAHKLESLRSVATAEALENKVCLPFERLASIDEFVGCVHRDENSMIEYSPEKKIIIMPFVSFSYSTCCVFGLKLDDAKSEDAKGRSSIVAEFDGVTCKRCWNWLVHIEGEERYLQSKSLFARIVWVWVWVWV